MHSPVDGWKNDSWGWTLVQLKQNLAALEVASGQQIAELFNSHFVNIADGVPEITEQIYGKGFDAHPSIQAIFNNNEQIAARNNFAFQYTNKTQVKALLLKKLP